MSNINFFVFVYRMIVFTRFLIGMLHKNFVFFIYRMYIRILQRSPTSRTLFRDFFDLTEWPQMLLLV